jgi:pimeloyl-ACP methyl ester carboxylesterase
LSTPIFWYIHGANSTPASFNFIRDQLPRHESIDYSYGHTEPLQRVVDRMVARANDPSSARPIYLVGHSLGGVIAAAVAQRSDRVEKVATIAAPFGGSNVAALMRWLTPCQLFEDIHPNAAIMSAIRRAPPLRNCLSIVTTSGGTPLMSEENDGVVSVASQIALKGPMYLRTPSNHFESLLSLEVIDLLNSFLFDH